MNRPLASEHAPDHERYISLVLEEDPLSLLADELERTVSLLRSVPEPESLVHHAPYTWSIRDVIRHVSDAERIFAYRALRIARGDKSPLAGFDENEYARVSQADRIPLSELTDEFDVVRRSSLALFRSLEPDDWTRTGIANDARVSVRALAYIIVGHERHHLAIVCKRLGRE